MLATALGSIHSKSMVFLTGYSGAGKSTIANALATRLVSCVVLDGDALRKAHGGNLPHGAGGLEVNTNRLIDLALTHFKSNDYVIGAFVAPRADLRERVRQAMASENIRFFEVHVQADIEVCMERDPKGLYGQYKSGECVYLAGLNMEYEVPKSPDLICFTAEHAVEENVSQILEKIGQAEIAVQASSEEEIGHVPGCKELSSIQ